MQFFFDIGNKSQLYSKWQDTLLNKLRMSDTLIYSPDFTPYFTKDTLNIVLHIRRGDIKQGTPKYVPDEYYLSLIDKFHSLYKDKLRYKIYIFTQKNGFNAELFDSKDCTIRTDHDDDQFTAFNHMMLANILVIPRSAFSYSAALLNRGGKILYKKINHTPLPSWVSCNDFVSNKTSLDLVTKSFNL